MATRFRRGPKASQEAAVSWAVAAIAAQFGRQSDCSVSRMSYEIDGYAVAIADVVSVSNKDVEVGCVLVDDYVVHMAAALADKMDKMSEVACLIARSIGHRREISARQDSCRSLVVAAHTLHVAEVQVSEVVRENIHCGGLQVV